MKFLIYSSCVCVRSLALAHICWRLVILQWHGFMARTYVSAVKCICLLRLLRKIYSCNIHNPVFSVYAELHRRETLRKIFCRCIREKLANQLLEVIQGMQTDMWNFLTRQVCMLPCKHAYTDISCWVAACRVATDFKLERIHIQWQLYMYWKIHKFSCHFMHSCVCMHACIFCYSTLEENWVGCDASCTLNNMWCQKEETMASTFIRPFIQAYKYL